MAPPEESKGPEGSGAPKKSGDGKEKSSGGRSGRKGNRFRRGRRRGRGQRPRSQGSGSGGGERAAGAERTERAERAESPQVAEIFPEAGGVSGLVDSHVHLEDAAYNGDRRKVFERALSRGVDTIITVGSDIESSRKTLDIAKTFPGVFAAVGIHPHEVKNMANKSASAIKSLSESPKVVAIGEIGLDYHYNHSPRKLQRHWFREQIRLAVKVGKPVIVHCREAGEDTFQILEEEKAFRVGGVVHCFTGDAELARKFLSLDLHLGAAGPITFEKSEELRAVFAEVPLERILVETDSPYLTPPPNRGKRNEPAFVVQVAETLAGIKGLSLEDVARATAANIRRLFKIGPDSQAGVIAYSISGKLYLNITNRCSNACFFCGLLSDRVYKGYDLTLEEEPSAEAILEAAGDPGEYEEVVFSGFGEPTLRMEELKGVAAELRARGAKRIRLVTNGLGSRTNGRNILPELGGLIDAVSISMQAESPESYKKICKTKDLEDPYPSIKEFIREAKSLFDEVEVTAVDMPGLIDIEACEEVVREELGVPFRRHSFSLPD